MGYAGEKIGGEVIGLMQAQDKETHRDTERLVPRRVQDIGVDLVNHPPHYKSGGIETIDFIEAKKLNYNLGNTVKYITRAELKGDKIQDLEKALWYLQREINTLKGK